MPSQDQKNQQGDDVSTQSSRRLSERSSVMSEPGQEDCKDRPAVRRPEDQRAAKTYWREKGRKRGRRTWREKNRQGDTLDIASGKGQQNGDDKRREDNSGGEEAPASLKEPGVALQSTSLATQVEGNTSTGRYSTTPRQPNEDAVVPLCVDGATQTEMDGDECVADAVVPMVRVCLLQTVRVPPRQHVLAKAKVEATLPTSPVLFEPDENTEITFGIHLSEALLEPCYDGVLQVPLANPTGFTQIIQAGEFIGSAAEASLVCTEKENGSEAKILIARTTPSEVTTKQKLRQKKLRDVVGEPDLSDADKDVLMSVLMEFHCGTGKGMAT